MSEINNLMVVCRACLCFSDETYGIFETPKEFSANAATLLRNLSLEV